jgi:hypothetical protein
MAAKARTAVLLARVPHAEIEKVMSPWPEWWRYFIKPAISNFDIVALVATDLLIRDSDRR